MNTKYILNKGQKINHWTVTEDIAISRTKAKTAHYLCKCDCGLTEKYVNASDLINNKTKCCNRCSLYKGIDKFTGALLAAIRKGARERNIDFNVSIEYLSNLLIVQKNKCALSGLDIYLSRDYNRVKQTASLDRIDSDKGYIEGNVQWVHKDINIMKNKYDQDYFIHMCKLVAGGACEIV